MSNKNKRKKEKKYPWIKECMKGKTSVFAFIRHNCRFCWHDCSRATYKIEGRKKRIYLECDACKAPRTVSPKSRTFKVILEKIEDSLRTPF